jgi:hypothetical protein
MPFTVEDFHDLVRILEEKPEWRAALRRQVLSDELLALPEQIVSLRAETERRFQALTAQVAELATAQKRTEEHLVALSGQVAGLAEVQKQTDAQVAELVQAVRVLLNDVGDLKGEALENRYRTKGAAYFGRLIRRAHVLSSDELVTMVEDAVDSGVLSDAQAQEIYDADVVVRGKRREDGAEIYLIVEVSWGVGVRDVDRALRRAALLATTGISVVPVVAGRWVTNEAAQLARTKQVWQLTDGHAVPPEPV